jgi:hypothetical protein
MLAKNKKVPKPKKRHTTLSEKAIGSVLIAAGIFGVVMSVILFATPFDEPLIYGIVTFIALFSLLATYTG